MPELRIVDDDLWAGCRRGRRARRSVNATGRTVSLWDRRRPRFLLSGLVKCGVCGSGFVKISEHHFGCAGARNKGTCSNSRGIRMEILEGAVLEGLQTHLMNDDLLEVFCDEYTRHLNQLRMEATGNRSKDEARFAKITREMDRLVGAIVQGVPAERIKDRMTALDSERITLEARMATQTAEVPPLLHPKMGDVYRKAVAGLRETLTSSPNSAEAIEHVRALIERIVLHPAADEPTGS